MRINLCPLCRETMRLWALDARRFPDKRDLCVSTATSFRDECCHTDREKYDALAAKLKALPLKTTWLPLAIWFEIERIKNCNGGLIPQGRTHNAWQSKWDERRAA